MEQSHTDKCAQTALSLLVDKIKAAEDGDMAMFIPVMDEIDKLAIQCFNTTLPHAAPGKAVANSDTMFNG